MQIQTISARKTLALVVLAASSALVTSASFAQSAGDFMVSAGWFHIAPQDSSTPLRATSSATSFSTVLPGSGASVEDLDTLGLSLSYFITDNWAATFDLGVPPKYKLDGSGTLSSVGRIGTARQWAPALLGKYYFGDANAKFRPSVGLGVTHVNYTNIELTNNFQHFTGSLFLDPNAVTSASLNSSWAPVFNVGLSYAINKDWYANFSVSYIKLKTTGTLTTPTNGPLGTITSTTELTLNPIVTYLNLGYRF
jgi:outer membrane protein